MTPERAPGSGIPAAPYVPLRVQADAPMIASNVDGHVAPSLEKISIIDDIYAFAKRLRDGSNGAWDPG